MPKEESLTETSLAYCDAVADLLALPIAGEDRAKVIADFTAFLNQMKLVMDFKLAESYEPANYFRA